MIGRIDLPYRLSLQRLQHNVVYAFFRRWWVIQKNLSNLVCSVCLGNYVALVLAHKPRFAWCVQWRARAKMFSLTDLAFDYFKRYVLCAITWELRGSLANAKAAWLFTIWRTPTWRIARNLVKWVKNKNMIFLCAITEEVIGLELCKSQSQNDCKSLCLCIRYISNLHPKLVK